MCTVRYNELKIPLEFCVQVELSWENYIFLVHDNHVNWKSKKPSSDAFFGVACAKHGALRFDRDKQPVIKYALDLKLAEFSYRPVLPSFSSETLMKSRFEEQNPRIASAKIIDTTKISVTFPWRMKVKRVDMKILPILNPKHTWLLAVYRGQNAGHRVSRTRYQKMHLKTFFDFQFM